MTTTAFSIDDPFDYFWGFNSYYHSEVSPGLIPKAGNLPQRLEQGLFPERISGTSFTAPRKDNRQTWTYRRIPSTSHSQFKELPGHPANFDYREASLRYKPNQAMWFPFPVDVDADFLTGLQHLGGAGSPLSRNGVAYYCYGAAKSMPLNQAFYTTDGDFLIVAQKGTLDITTELGSLRVRPCEVCVIPQGIRYRVSVVEGPARGFVLEAFSGHFDLPELGPIGSYGLANVRDFQIPKAAVDHSEENTEILCKFNGKIHTAQYKGPIFNVAAWHGTYYPFKYDLGRFMAIGSISYDHHDPSIFTVLTCPSDKPNLASVDFIVLPPRWIVMEDTFRPPYYHRNTMSEFAGLLKGGFDVDEMDPSLAGTAVLINSLSPHGPGKEAYQTAVSKVLKPEKIGPNSMAFVWESCYMIGLTAWADEAPNKIDMGNRLDEFEVAKL